MSSSLTCKNWYLDLNYPKNRLTSSKFNFRTFKWSKLEILTKMVIFLLESGQKMAITPYEPWRSFQNGLQRIRRHFSILYIKLCHVLPSWNRRERVFTLICKKIGILGAPYLRNLGSPIFGIMGVH